MMNIVTPSLLSRKRYRGMMIGGIGIPLALFLLTGWFLIQNFIQRETFVQELRRTQESLLLLEVLVSTIKDAELGQQGYLITGNEAYLEPYDRALKQIAQAIIDLQVLMANNPRQLDRLNALIPLAQQKLEESQQIIQLRRNGEVEQALEIVQSNLGKSLMDHIRNLTDVMTTDEQLRRDQQRTDFNESQYRSILLYIGGTFFSLLMVGSMIILLVREISVRQRFEESLQQSQDFIRQVSELSPTMMYVFDLQDSHSVYFNKAGTEFLGVDSAEVRHEVMQRVFEIERIHVDDRGVRENMRQRWQSARDGEIIESEFRLKNYNNEWRWMYCRDVVFSRSADEKPKQIVGIAVDISARKILEQQEKERADVLKKFIENASHDLNTPITVLATSVAIMERYCEMLDQQLEKLSEDDGVVIRKIAPELTSLIQKNCQKIKGIDEAVDQLKSRVGDMLDMVRLDGEMVLNSQRRDLNPIVAYATANCQPQADKQGIRLNVTSATEPHLIYADEEKLVRAIGNLITNAINYNVAHGEVKISTAVTDDGYEVVIQDTGIGIAEQDLPHIFERFYRADQARSTRTGGTGLGLTMSKQIIEAHGGSIRVSSVLGKGTTVRVRFPQAQVEEV